MKQKLLNIFRLRAVMFVALICAAFTGAWATPTTYTFNSSIPTSGWSTSGGSKTINSISWTYSSCTYIGAQSTRIQIGSKNNPQTSDWTISTAVTNFGSEKKITAISITAYTTATSATYDISAGGSSVKSGSLTTSSATYSVSNLDITSGDIVITLTGSSTSRAMYLSDISVTYDDASSGDLTATVTTFNGESSYDVELGQSFTAPTATVSVKNGDPIEGASVTYSSSKPGVAAVDENTGAVTLVAAGKTTITASYEGDETYASSSASYELTVTKPVPVFASLEELVADENVESGDIVNVSFQNVEIKSIFENKSGVRQGIYFDIQKGDKDIEIYYSAEEVPETWVAGGTVSGTMQCPWKNYNGTWELAPDYNTWSWNNLDYQAPAGAKTQATIDFTSKSNLEAGATDQFDVTYNGDGTLEASSTKTGVATVAIEAGHVVVTAIAAGTTVITVSAPETDEYTEASKQYTLTVSQAFDRNVHKALVAEKDGKYFAAYNTIEGSNTYFAVKEVTVYNNKVYNLSDAEAAELAWLINKNSGTATVQNLNNEYLQLTTNKSTVSLSEDEVVLYTKTDGCFYVTETGRGFGYNYNQGNDRMAGYSISAQYPGAKAMEFAAENETANMRISAAAWGTFWAPFAVEIPAGVKAYTGEMQEGWIRMNELTEGYIPANTGVVVNLVEGEPFDTDLSPMDPQPNAAAVPSCYTGNATGAIMNVEDGDYLLQKQNDVVGWYKVEGEGFTLAPYRCYLAKGSVPAPNQSRTFFGFAPDDATGINSIATEAMTKADGKYMVNGQIVVVKAGKAYNMNGTEVK